jgi:hypothetical protein
MPLGEAPLRLPHRALFETGRAGEAEGRGRTMTVDNGEGREDDGEED